MFGVGKYFKLDSPPRTQGAHPLSFKREGGRPLSDLGVSMSYLNTNIFSADW